MREIVRNLPLIRIQGSSANDDLAASQRAACNYIHGWLHYYYYYCLQACIRLSERRPDYFGV